MDRSDLLGAIARFTVRSAKSSPVQTTRRPPSRIAASGSRARRPDVVACERQTTAKVGAHPTAPQNSVPHALAFDPGHLQRSLSFSRGA